jgi:hypothetical protein
MLLLLLLLLLVECVLCWLHVNACKESGTYSEGKLKHTQKHIISFLS